MTKREFIDTIADIPDDAEIVFSVDVSEKPCGEMTLEEEVHITGRRAFANQSDGWQEMSCGEYMILLSGHLNY